MRLLRTSALFALVIFAMLAWGCVPKPQTTQLPNTAAPSAPPSVPTTSGTGSSASSGSASSEPTPVAPAAGSQPTTTLPGVSAKIGTPVEENGVKLTVRSVGVTNNIAGKMMKAGGIMQVQVGIDNTTSKAIVIKPANFSLQPIAGTKGSIKPAPGPGIVKKIGPGESVTTSAFFLVPEVNGDYVMLFTAPGSKKAVKVDVRVR